MNVVRWQFQDLLTNEVHTVELNPNTAAGITFSRAFLAWGRRDGTRMSGTMANREPAPFQFGGVVRREDHHDSLIAWQQRGGKVRITDHLGRVFDVMIRSLDLTDRQATATNRWRFQYQFDCLLLRRVA